MSRIITKIIFTGSILLFAAAMLTSLQSGSNGQFGGLIMIGPIPIVFGSSTQITTTMLGLGLIIMLIYLFTWRKAQTQGYEYERMEHPQEQEPEDENGSKADIRGGGVIMLGPIPIVFGSDKKSAETSIILAIILMVLAYLFLR